MALASNDRVVLLVAQIWAPHWEGPTRDAVARLLAKYGLGNPVSASRLPHRARSTRAALRPSKRRGRRSR
jgi:hypothetical protein